MKTAKDITIIPGMAAIAMLFFLVIPNDPVRNMLIGERWKANSIKTRATKADLRGRRSNIFAITNNGEAELSIRFNIQMNS